MSENVIELRGVSKIYKKVKVVDDVSMVVKRGHIMGLLGPNGAGKTTIFKLLADLATPDEGTICFFNSETTLCDNRKKMSFMLEEPILDPMMNAKSNMRYISYMKGVSDSERKIKEILEQVGLGDTGKKAVRNFSLGMRQRLGIAMALLNNPKVLVLDEPMNGLDPEGMVEIRNLLRNLAKIKKVTILISSHMLPELSELCTDYAIINHGKLIETGCMSDLLENSKKHLVICTDDNEKTIALLKEKFAILKYRISQKNEIYLYDSPENIENIAKSIMEAGILIYKFSYEGESLEQYYLSRVGGLNG